MNCPLCNFATWVLVSYDAVRHYHIYECANPECKAKIGLRVKSGC